MGTLELETPYPNTITTNHNSKQPNEQEEEESPIEEVRLTVTNTDDPTLPVWTFRMWFLGLLSCGLLSFLNQFFAYRTEPLVITQITVQVATLPIGHFLAAVLPEHKFRVPGFGSRLLSLNPGPFNMKEHVLISIFANAGSAFGNGSAYAVGIVTIVKAFYGRNISFLAGVGIRLGWALEKVCDRAGPYVVARYSSPAPGYLFPTLTSISWICWTFSKSVTAQQLGSGLRGLGLGALTLDWTAVASFLFSPLICPFFAIMNVFAGYALIIYIVLPTAYWGFDLYGASKFPIFSSHLFTAQGQKYNITAIVNDKFELDLEKYKEQGRIHLSMFFALTYGFGFATIAATLTHVGCFYGREIYARFRASYKEKDDIHTRLMRVYKDIPSWWFYLLLAGTLSASLIMCIVLKDQIQMPWWGLVFASLIAFIFTLPISIITATTNQTPGLNIITEYVMGIIYPGRPIANVCFKTYGYMSMAQAVSFLSDFKLGHYMKIPPRSMFIVQFLGTIIAGTVNISVAWWLLTSITNICQDDLLPPDSPWTCPGDRVFFDASVIWGLVGPRRIFGSQGNYSSMNWFFLGGAIGPILVWIFHKAFPKQSWIPLINLPVLLGATGAMPPATPLNYNAWIIIGTIFNFFVFRYRKSWWQRYNYILSAALDAGVAFMAVVLYFTLGMENRGLDWWGTSGEHCKLATCPTARGIQVDGCPVH
ncbi:oligopeptide transporter 4 [Phtheirospermum japonicum]|uniref:Oligopeptide transporter 4 n=1 Tax=Phtheirospermum japonicum TaxID=374723 RepID=A0A830BXQ1_9LAMI|nr:oligopeptide transporter 4 [Phtheirospermum japonicum]